MMGELMRTKALWLFSVSLIVSNLGLIGCAIAAGPDNNPKGATALCRDGTYSHSKHHRGTCSHHGGVAKWLRVVPK